MKGPQAHDPNRDPFYYQKDFLELFHFVIQRYEDFWTPQEKNLADRFLKLNHPAQALYIRLTNRKGSAFKRSQIQYTEIQNLSKAMEELIHHGFCTNKPEIEHFEDCLKKCAVKDLRSWLVLSEPKGACVAKALGQEKAAILDFLGSDWLCLNHVNWFEFLPQLFFCNRHQDMTTFVLNGLGQVVYQEVTLDLDTRFFPDRHAFETWLDWHGARDAIEELEAGHFDWCEIVDRAVNQWTPHHPSRRTMERIVQVGVAWALKQGRPDLWTNWLPFFRHKRLPMTVYPSIRRQRKNNPKDFNLDWFEHGEVSQWPILDQIAFCKTFPELASKPKQLKAPEIHFSAQKKGLFQGKSMYAEGLQAMHIEPWVLCQYQKLGYQGFFAENAFSRTLFALMAWEIIFADIPGVFQHPFQDGPLDLGKSDFFNKRAHLFSDGLWSQFSTEQFSAELQKRWDEHAHKNCRLNHAQFLDRSLFFKAVSLVQPMIWAKMMNTFFRQERALWRGFPDLIMWREEEILFVEVKARPENVSPYQMNWHHTLMSHGLTVNLVRVTDH